nr:hypothetical protein [Entomoplasma sp. MP1]
MSKMITKNITSNTLKATIDFQNKTATKQLLFTTDLTKYNANFRDPNIIDIHGKTYMLNGAQDKNGNGVLSVYKKKKINGSF